MSTGDEKITLLARVARTRSSKNTGGGALADDSRAPASSDSILSLAAASYGAKPHEDATVPTGFDPIAVALFEAIVEGAYLVAAADGVVDEAERREFERVVVAACGGAVAPKSVADLVADLADQLGEDGLDRRIAALAERVSRRAHAFEVLRIAALLAQASDNVSDVERSVMTRIAKACGLEASDVDVALEDVRQALAAAEAASVPPAGA
jgi:tellurite resistance protein